MSGMVGDIKLIEQVHYLYESRGVPELVRGTATNTYDITQLCALELMIGLYWLPSNFRYGMYGSTGGIPASHCRRSALRREPENVRPS